MADPNFFDRGPALSLKELAALSGSELVPGSDPSYMVDDVAPLDKAGPKHLSFFDNVKYRDQFRATKAGACFVMPDAVKDAPKGLNMLVSKSAYRSYALAAQKFYPDVRPKDFISPQAIIDPTAKIGKDSSVEAGVFIGPGVVIGEGASIEANVVIGRNVQIGDHCRIGPGATITHAIIGHHVRLYPGVRVGQDGFGFSIDKAGFVKIPQLGRVIIEDHVEIGANTCIDRGSGPDTIIGQGSWLDNLIQIGHNVKVGKGCAIAAQVGISGSTVIEDYVMIGGQAGVAGHLHIGKGARLGAQAGVLRDVPAGEEQMGYPAQPGKKFLRQVVLLNRLINKEKGS